MCVWWNWQTRLPQKQLYRNRVRVRVPPRILNIEFFKNLFYNRFFLYCKKYYIVLKNEIIYDMINTNMSKIGVFYDR